MFNFFFYKYLVFFKYSDLKWDIYIYDKIKI